MSWTDEEMIEACYQLRLGSDLYKYLHRPGSINPKMPMPSASAVYNWERERTKCVMFEFGSLLIRTGGADWRTIRIGLIYSLCVV